MDLPDAFRRMLHLSKAPDRIEIYDNSHSHGQSPSGIMVVFEGFKPKKNGYRVFHIREASPEDDVAMMAEVLRRRVDDERIRPLPDLVVIDGGKAQLSAALVRLQEPGDAHGRYRHRERGAAEAHGRRPLSPLQEEPPPPAASPHRSSRRS